MTRSFMDTAESRETSPDLMYAILTVAGGNEDRAERIWEEGPNAAELEQIIEIVKADGCDPDDLVWGDSGDAWATEPTRAD